LVSSLQLLDYPIIQLPDSHDDAASDHNHLARDERGGGRCEKYCRARDIVGHAPSLERRRPGDRTAQFLVRAGAKRRFDPARREDVDAHARRDRSREAFAEGENAALGGAINLRIESAHAGDHVIPAHVDDHAAAFLRAQQIGRLPRRQHRPAKIHSEDSIDFLAGRKRRSGAGQDVGARVVHPDIQAAERTARGGTEGAERLIVSQIEGQRCGASSERADLALNFTRARLVHSIGDRDIGSGAGGGERNRPADAAGGARHEHTATGERRRDGVGCHEGVLYDPLRMVSNRIADRPGELNTLRLTSLSHGGGCGCKLAPAVLEQIIAKAAGSAAGVIPPQLLVGIETSDDAAVYQINETQAIVATTDFFMPIVDDPFDFGAIAATNAISDVYAMGGSPLFALAIVAMPIDKVPLETIRRILQGGESACQRAGIPVAGGHSVDSVEPIYGLVAIGLVDPRDVKRNREAKPGDKIVLGKALGVGVYGAAVKKQQITDAQYREMIASTTQLNTPGRRLARLPGVHALTDVTGFGLLGHLMEVCKGSGVHAAVRWNAVPLLVAARELALAGHVTGGSSRNWAGYGSLVDLGSCGDIERALLTDPQTSGGLLVACAAEAADDVLQVFESEGFPHAAVIGEVSAGPPGITVV
jgi:selenide,water dikinase